MAIERDRNRCWSGSLKVSSHGVGNNPHQRTTSAREKSDQSQGGHLARDSGRGFGWHCGLVVGGEAQRGARSGALEG